MITYQKRHPTVYCLLKMCGITDIQVYHVFPGDTNCGTKKDFNGTLYFHFLKLNIPVYCILYTID